MGSSTIYDYLAALWSWLSEVLPGNNEIAKDVVKTLAVASLVALLTWISRKLIKRVKPIIMWVWPSDDYRWRVERARSAVAQGGPGLWLALPPKRPPEYADRMKSSPPILAVANEKGGVGKTTTITNLASAFAKRCERPVLLIDLDFQGSSGALMHAGTDWEPKLGHLSPASEAISDELTPDMLARSNGVAKEFTWTDHRDVTRHTPNARGLSAFYDLKDMEDRVMVEWLIGDRLQDVRYTLYDLLRQSQSRE